MTSADIWIGAEDWPGKRRNAAEENTDVVVTLADGSRWTATFFAYGNVELLKEAGRRTGEGLGGTYYWAPNLVLIEEVTREGIEHAVEDLLAQGEFELAFRRLEGNAASARAAAQDR